MEVPASGVYQLKCLEGGFASGKWHTNQRTNQTGVVIQLTTLPVRTCIDLMVSSAFSAAELVCYPWMEEGGTPCWSICHAVQLSCGTYNTEYSV